MAHRSRSMRIGTYLISKGLLTKRQAQEVLNEQATEGPGLRERFGRIAVRRGFVTEQQMNHAFLQKEREEALR